MTDELTPEERQALENLPKERMPAGLEGRVVGAMRERGFLARPRRTIEVSNARVGGLLAACIALIVGAYSIGLHRGDDSPVLRVTETPKQEDSGRADMPLVSAPAENKAKPPLAKDTGRNNIPESKKVSSEPLAPAPPAPTADEASTDQIAQGKARDEKLAASESEVAELPAAAAPKQVVSMESAARLQAPQEGVVSATSKSPITFYLNGSPVIVEAPDSVRIVQDEQGRMLIIYTSDGIIRIRLGDNR